MARSNVRIGALACFMRMESTPRLLEKWHSRKDAVSPAEPENNSTQNKDVKGTSLNDLQEGSGASTDPIGGSGLLEFGLSLPSHSFDLPWSGKAWAFRQCGFAHKCQPLSQREPGFALSQPCKLKL